jgi:hypothetical protein
MMADGSTSVEMEEEARNLAGRPEDVHYRRKDTLSRAKKSGRIVLSLMALLAFLCFQWASFNSQAAVFSLGMKTGEMETSIYVHRNKSIPHVRMTTLEQCFRAYAKQAATAGRKVNLRSAWNSTVEDGLPPQRISLDHCFLLKKKAMDILLSLLQSVGAAAAEASEDK